MTEIFKDGFESGNTSAWDEVYVTAGESVSVVQGTPKEGQFCLLCTSPQGGSDLYAMVRKNVNLGLVYARCYAKPQALNLPNETNRVNVIVLWPLGNVSITKVAGVNQFQLRMWDSVANVWRIANTGIEAQLDKWYCVELGVQVGAWAKVWIDGVQVTQLDMTNITANIATIGFGVGAETPIGNALSQYIDACVIADAYIGPYVPPPPPANGGGVPITTWIIGGVALAASVIVAILLLKKK